MAELLSEHQLQVVAAANAAPHLLLALDYDGTLAPIAARPELAFPLPGTLDLLAEFAASPRRTVVIVTGRAIDDVRKFIDLPQLAYVGLHGAELKRVGGELESAAETRALQPLIAEIADTLARRLGPRPGVWFENKRLALACHYRQASAEDAEAVRQAATAWASEYRGEVALSLIHGHAISEFRSALFDKGKALLSLAARHPQPTLIFYAGDDTTDEDAFRQLPPSAITVRIGGAEVKTAARYRSDSPGELRDFLETLLRAET